jgi:transcription elongation factor Elf1
MHMSSILKELHLKWYPEGGRTCKRCKRTNEAGEEFKYFAFNHLCPSCYKWEMDKQKMEKREEIVSGERDTDYEGEITCPYCGYEFSDSWEFITGNNDEDLGEIVCHECDKTFTCSASYSVSFSTQKIDD